MKKEQSAKLLKEIEKFNFIKYNDLLTTQWNSFYKHIDLSFDNFYSMLKENHSCLNEKEMQLCCMLIAGFKTEEIAAIWMQSIFSVHKYKTNIRKKIKAPDGANIITFLSQKNEINKKDKYYKSFSIFTTDNQLIKSNHYNKINSIINGFYIYIA